MDDEIEDLVGVVKYTDSQKSVTTHSSLAYSPDFTDCSSTRSDKHNSIGKETYVIECDSEDSEKSEPTYLLHKCASSVDRHSSVYTIGDSCMGPPVSVQCGPSQTNTKCASTSYHMIAQETYTQTSKTVIEIAEAEGGVRRITDSNTLETQTSRVSIRENKTVEYSIEGFHQYGKYNVIVEHNQTLVQLEDNVYHDQQNLQQTSEYYNSEPSPPMKPKFTNLSSRQFLHAPLDDRSSCIQPSEFENEPTEGIYRSDDDCYSEEGDERIIKIINDESNESITDGDQTLLSNSSASETYPTTDIEEDSLMEVKPKTSKVVKELHNKLSENDEVCMKERFGEPDIWRFGTLTPLTEETNAKKESLQDIGDVPSQSIGDANCNSGNEDVLFTSPSGVKVKVLKDGDTVKVPFKLPPIQNQSCPNSPQLNSLFGKPKLCKAGTLPSVYEKQNQQDRWEIANKTLASGESPLISGRSEPPRKLSGLIQLPPIHGEAPLSAQEESVPEPPAPAATKSSENQDAISIADKIKELKLNSRRSWSQKYSSSRTHSPTISPDNSAWQDDNRDIADRGCDAVCADLMRRLRSNSWYEVIECLEAVPKDLEKFWEVITETRIADILRQVNGHLESPRTQVAKTACATAAAIIKNTNYTRKPDFYETVTTLLIKTGSYSRVVRRAANLALDNIVCGVDMTHSVTALCIHGVGHKNALVRCASARLLVVCCALAGGGRELLRTRPASSATARRHVLRSLSVLLDDKSTDVRKYAERLYSMLRPLSNFEAYYLTDVDVELASKQMKKYDQVLLRATKETR